MPRLRGIPALTGNGCREYARFANFVDRVARDIHGHWDFRDLLREAGGGLVSPKMEFKDDADSMMVENIHTTFAQHFRQKNAEQTTRRMRARVMNGYWPFQAPVGYEHHPVKDRGRMLRRAEPAASIEEALEGYVSLRHPGRCDAVPARPSTVSEGCQRDEMATLRLSKEKPGAG